MKLIYLRETNHLFTKGEEYDSFWETETTYLFELGKYIHHADKINFKTPQQIREEKIDKILKN